MVRESRDTRDQDLQRGGQAPQAPVAGPYEFDFKELLHWPMLGTPQRGYDLDQVLAEREADLRPGVFELGLEWDHPLVQVHLRLTRRRRWLLAAFLTACALSPLVLATLPGRYEVTVQEALVAFAAIWPLLMVLGSSLSAATAIIAERANDTALQLTLTPLRKSTIAAGAILPARAPWMYATCAALPVYLLAARAPALWSPLALWPLRLFAPLMGGGAPGSPVAGAVSGVVMCVTDCLMVHAAAHWGAAYGVRSGSVLAVALHMVGRVAQWCLTLLLCLFVAGLPLLLGGLIALVSSVALDGERNLVAAFVAVALSVVAVILSLVLLVRGYRRFMLQRAVSAVMAEFAWFDRLADPDFVSGLRKPARFWTAWWDDTARR